jgi:HK97 family phage major capsid protein
MDAQKMKESFEEVNKIFYQFKQEHEENLKSKVDSAEFNQKIDKMSDDMTKKMQEYNEKLLKIESLNNSKSKENEREENLRKIETSFNKFARFGGAHRTTFSDWGRANNVDINALTVDSEPDGGYLVQPTYDSIRKTREFETSPLRQLASVQTIGTDSLIIPVDQDEAAAAWVGERQTRTLQNTPEIKQIKIEAHELEAFQAASTKILDDASLNLETWLAKHQSDKFARTEATAFISGNASNRPKGILSYAAWTANGTYEFNKIEQVNSKAAAALTADGLKDLQNSLSEGYQPGAAWIMKRATFGVITKLKQGTGEYLFNRALSNNVGQPFDLLGAPVYFASDMEAISANNLPIAYGDFKRGYQIVDRIGIRMLRDPYTNRPFINFIATKRVGGGVFNFEAIKLQKVAA